MTMRTAMLALAIGLLSAAALGILANSTPIQAEGPTGQASASITFEEPLANGEDGSMSLSVRLTSADGEPIIGQRVGFFVTPAFLGERPLPLSTARTDPQGIAMVSYTPTWEGEHRITALFTGNETYQSVEATSALELSAAPSIYTPLAEPLSPLRQWATPGAIVVVLAVWLILALVLVRVGWGIWYAGRRGEAAMSPVPAAADLLPESTFETTETTFSQ